MNNPRTNKYIWFGVFGFFAALIFIAISVFIPLENTNEIALYIEKYAVVAVLVRVSVISISIYIFYNNILSAAERYTGIDGFKLRYEGARNKILIWYIAIEAVLLLSFI